MPPRGAQNTWTRESEQDLTLAVVGYLSAEDIKKIKNTVGWDKVTETMHSWGYQWNKDAMISRWNKKILGDFKKRRTDGIGGQEVHPVAPRGSGQANTGTNGRGGEKGSKKKRSRAEAEADEHEDGDGGDNDLEELDSDEMPMANVKRVRRGASAQSAPAAAGSGSGAPGATKKAMKKGGDADLAAVDAATDPASPSRKASPRKKKPAAPSAAAGPIEDPTVEGEAAPSSPVVSAAAARGARARKTQVPFKNEKPEVPYSSLDDYEV